MSLKYTGTLAVIGALFYIAGLAHNILGIHFGTRLTIGPMDSLFCLVGVVLVIPHMSVLAKNTALGKTLMIIGVPVVIFALVHDAIGITIARGTIGPLDTLVWLAGVMLLMPYLLSLAKE